MRRFVRGPLRRRIVVALGVAVAVYLPFGGGQDRPRVAIVGDSNTVLLDGPSPLSDEGAIDDALHPRFWTVVEAERGTRIVDMLDALRRQVDDPTGRPDAVVIYLGTNDVRTENPDWRPAFDEMLSIVSDVPCVELVTVNTATDLRFGRTDVTAVGINDAIAAAAAAEPDRVHVIDWDVDWTEEMGAPDPEVTQHLYSVFVPAEDLGGAMRAQHPDGMWVGDGVHQSPEGSIVLARAYRDELVADCFPELADD